MVTSIYSKTMFLGLSMYGGKKKGKQDMYYCLVCNCKIGLKKAYIGTVIRSKSTTVVYFETFICVNNKVVSKSKNTTQSLSPFSYYITSLR